MESILFYVYKSTAGRKVTRIYENNVLKQQDNLLKHRSINPTTKKHSYIS